MQTTNWKWFLYQEIFDIRKGQRLTKANMIDGLYPFIGATETNNGVTGQVGNDEFLHPGNVITVSYNGSIGNAFYQDREFLASDDINVLYPKFSLTKLIAFFLITLIEKEKYRYSYGNKWDSSTMKLSKIELPILSDGSPDWGWIEKYVKNTLITQLPKTAQEIFSEDFRPHSVSNKKLTLDTTNWKTFFAKDIFKINLGRPIHKSDLENELSLIGKPYITRTAENNGIEGYVDEEIEENLNSGNAITIGAEGFTAFYQEGDFYNGNKISIFRNPNLNKYSALFLSTVLDKEVKDRFSYGRGAVKGKLETMKIKLPVNSSGFPDWQWMEDYIKGLSYSASI